MSFFFSLKMKEIVPYPRQPLLALLLAVLCAMTVVEAISNFSYPPPSSSQNSPPYSPGVPPLEAPIFLHLRRAISETVGTTAAAGRHDEISRNVQEGLTTTYPQLHWGTIAWNDVDNNAYIPGAKSGAKTNECDVPVPPNSCVRTGGAVYVVKELEGNTLNILAFMIPAEERQRTQEELAAFSESSKANLVHCWHEQHAHVDLTRLVDCAYLRYSNDRKPRALVLVLHESSMGYDVNVGSLVDLNSDYEENESVENGSEGFRGIRDEDGPVHFDYWLLPPRLR